MGTPEKRILVFGYFGYFTDQRDGQTIKTRSVYDLLRKETEYQVSFADTQQFRHSAQAVLKFLKDIVRSHCVIYLPAHNNLKYIFPFLFLSSKVFGFDIVYIVIGGWLPEFLAKLPIHRWMLRRIKRILLENSLAMQQLREMFNIQNTGVIPNFRLDD